MKRTINGKMSAGLRIAIDPSLRDLTHEVCSRRGVELSDLVRDAMLSFLKENGVEVEYTARRRGRPPRKEMEAIAA